MTIAKYQHACDASAAATISGTNLFAAASDEDSVLRVYDRAAGGPPVSSHDVAADLGLDDPEKPETDIEGAAQLGDRMYWIGSHGRNNKAKVKKNRQCFFATTIERSGPTVRLRLAGKAYKNLLNDLGSAPALAPFKLKAAFEAEISPEAPGGFNIEGLAPALEAGHLLIGFRNPVPQGKALIVRLSNPAALVDGTAAAAELAVAGVLDLQGRGIRALEFVPSSRRYLILAGAVDDGQQFRLYEWTGRADAQPRVLIDDISDLRPEELIVLDANAREITLQLLSDDGTDVCKDAPMAQRSFRGRSVTIPLASATAQTGV
jgi:hypothetical protein